MSNHLQILEMLLSHSGFPHVFKEAVRLEPASLAVLYVMSIDMKGNWMEIRKTGENENTRGPNSRRLVGNIHNRVHENSEVQSFPSMVILHVYNPVYCYLNVFSIAFIISFDVFQLSSYAHCASLQEVHVHMH